MVLNSEFWINFVYFLLQVILAILGIWIGVYFFLRQQNKDLENKFESILSRLRQIDRGLAELTTTVGMLNRTTETTMMHSMETQREVLLELVKHQPTSRPYYTDDDLPSFSGQN